MKSELYYQIALSQIPNIGPILAKNLLSYCGSPEAVFRENVFSLSKIPGIGTITAKQIHRFDDFEWIYKEIEFIESQGVQVIFFTSSAYPRRLKAIPDAPIILFKKGSHDLNSDRMLGIVGTRLNSQHGRKVTENLIADLKEHNCTVVSGLALGIDHVAHCAAIKSGLPTVAVLGHGLGSIYPSRHHGTAKQILNQGGGLVTEFVSFVKPDRENFPKRNRIVAGLVDGLIVIESKRKGGSMITADLAFQYDREVMAVPGRTGDDLASGCHLLIKQDKARLIEDVIDIAKILGYDQDSKSKSPQKTLLLDLSSTELEIVNSLKSYGKLSFDSLLSLSSLSITKLSQLLLELEFKDLIRTLPGKCYELI